MMGMMFKMIRLGTCIKLNNLYKTKKYKYSLKYNTLIYKLKISLLKKFISDDDLIEYCIDTDLMTDYYNEAPEYEDYYHDRD